MIVMMSSTNSAAGSMEDVYKMGRLVFFKINAAPGVVRGVILIRRQGSHGEGLDIFPA